MKSLLTGTALRALLIAALPALARAEAARPTELCVEYWQARKAGTDWRMQPPLDQFDDACAPHLIVGVDWEGNCAVSSLVIFTGKAHHFRTSEASLSWFPCLVNGVEGRFGDVVLGDVETICDRSATGSFGTCRQTIKPTAIVKLTDDK